MSLQRKYHGVSGRAATAAIRRRLKKRTQRALPKGTKTKVQMNVPQLLYALRVGALKFELFPGETELPTKYHNY